ncbi:MAG: hypothetical protein ACLFPP_11615 [Spirochaetaceae bacterium]
MRERAARRYYRRCIALGALIPLLASLSFAQSSSVEGSHPFREPSLGAGAPFSLNAYDAVHALYLLRRELFLQVLEEEGEYRTVRIRRVRAVRLPDAEYPLTPFERKRYDILVNGEPLDWERSFIEYDERRVNMRLLYTYRNGGLPEGLLYEGPP